jgi:DNA gyrase subunit A
MHEHSFPTRRSSDLDDDEVIIMTDKGKLIRCSTQDIRIAGRNTQGVRLVNLSELEQLASIEPIIEYSDN